MDRVTNPAGIRDEVIVTVIRGEPTPRGDESLDEVYPADDKPREQ